MARYPKSLKEVTTLQHQAIAAVEFMFNTLEQLVGEYAHDAEFAQLYQAPPPLAQTPTPEQLATVPAANGNPPPVAKPQTSGVLIIALGHPYYGEMAANLAASIRFTDPTVPIHLVWADKALTHLDAQKLKLFTSMAEAPNESFHKNGKRVYFKAKTWMHDFSPFDRTLFLDADMLWFSHTKMSDFMLTLQGVPFTIQNRDSIDLATVKPGDKPFYLWADVAELKKAYGFEAGKLYGLHSELVYFEKGAAVAEFFASVKQIFDAPLVVPFKFAGDMADELAFAIAMIQHGIAPHKEPFSPVYWWKLDGANGVSYKISNLAKNYVAYSVGGNVQPAIMVNTYNIMSRAYARPLGIHRVWSLKNKRQFIADRKVL